MFVLMAKIYYSKRKIAKSAERKGTWGEVWRKPDVGFPKSSLSGITQDMLTSSSSCCDTCEMFARDAHQRFSAKGFNLVLFTLAPSA